MWSDKIAAKKLTFKTHTGVNRNISASKQLNNVLTKVNNNQVKISIMAAIFFLFYLASFMYYHDSQKHLNGYSVEL